MQSTRSVLFVSHDAYRGGATLMLLNFLRWLKENSHIDFHILLCARGELERDFAELAPVWYLDARAGRRYAVQGALRALWPASRRNRVVRLSDLAEHMRGVSDFGLIYSNTVLNGRALEALSPLGCSVLTHVHELEHQIHTVAGPAFAKVKAHTHRYIVVSQITGDNLIKRHGIRPDQIQCVPGFIPAAAGGRSAAASKEALAAELGIDSSAQIVGGCGNVYWLKGCDLLAQLAVHVRARAPSLPVHIVWIGEKPRAETFYSYQFELERANVASRVHFIGKRANVRDYIAAFDVHALVSREETLSLVMLEAATCGVPTVCFEGTGACEFVETDAGAVVPYLDVSAMSEEILRLLRDRGLREALGSRALAKVRERHDINVSAPQLLATMRRLLDVVPRTAAL